MGSHGGTRARLGLWHSGLHAVGGALGGWGRGSSTHEVAPGERAAGVGHEISRHLFVTPEIPSLQGTVRGDKAGEFVGIKLVLVLVPEKLLGGEPQARLGEDAHSAAEFPQLVLVVVISCVALDIGVDVELLVKLREEHTLVENVARRIEIGIDHPTLGDNAVFDDTRVGNECVDPIARHQRHGIARMDGGRGVFHLLLARAHGDQCARGEEEWKYESKTNHFAEIILPSTFGTTSH